MDGIYTDENRKYQIDLSAAIWHMGTLKQLYDETIGGALSDVDWIAETEDEIFLIEYKNPSFVQKHGKNEFYFKVQQKYYGSTFFMLARENKKPINFMYIIDDGIMDSVLRKKATASIMKRLPFELQKKEEIFLPLIKQFSILIPTEWNDTYPQFPLTRLQPA